MACAMMTYNNVTEAVWDGLKKAVAEYGVTISADTGTAAAYGYTVSWNYDRQLQHFQIQCIASPFFVPCSAVNSHVNETVEACLKRHNIEVANMVPV